ncbi:MAG: Phage integrase SAM-like domain, partial [Solirubrobacteraceae bacterium]|nr:Phage integrase SAM-like domain [Solirubrobacteraceae bacterium]
MVVVTSDETPLNNAVRLISGSPVPLASTTIGETGFEPATARPPAGTIWAEGVKKPPFCGRFLPFDQVRSGQKGTQRYTDRDFVSPAKRVTPRRRDYGTGTLRVVRGSWLASWYAADGRRVQRKVGPARTEGRSDGLTKAQAEKALRRIREIEPPRAVASSRRVTMAEAGAELCRRLELKGRKKSHRLTVASDLRNHIEPFFGERTIDRITPDDIERYVAVKERTLAIKTIRNDIGTMHSVFEVGLRKGWCQSNPVKLADRPVIRTTETRIKFLDQDELEKLLAVPYPDDA